MKKYWNSLWDNPYTLRAIHGWLTIVWATQIPVVLIFKGLQESLPYLVIISVAAALLGQLSSWQAARTECKQFETDRRIEALLASLTAADDMGQVDVPPEGEGAQNGS